MSPPEACWRIFEFPIHDRSHTVYRLPVHEENRQVVQYEEGDGSTVREVMEVTTSKLIEWFNLNQRDENARQYLYTEIPIYYTWKKNVWISKQREVKNVVRMYQSHIKQGERYYLRLMLLHVRGAKSFKEIRTHDGIEYPTFKECAAAAGLLDSDELWIDTMNDSATFNMPAQMRDVFAYILVYANVTDPLGLFTQFKNEMSLDYNKNYNMDDALNLSLRDISEVLQINGVSLGNYNLPDPVIPKGIDVSTITNDDFTINPEEEFALYQELYTGLNAGQLEAFKTITQAIDDERMENRCFFLDGPGEKNGRFYFILL